MMELEMNNQIKKGNEFFVVVGWGSAYVFEYSLSKNQFSWDQQD